MSNWIRIEDRFPTEEDANKRGLVVAIEKDEHEAKFWSWNIVVRYAHEFTYWMPVAEPKEGEEV